MKQKVPVEQIMTTKLVTLTLSDTLYDAEKHFKQYKIRHIPIVDNKKLIGILSYSDLLKISYADMVDEEENVSAIVYDMYSIAQVMAKVLIKALPSDTIKSVTETLAVQSFHSIPIVDEHEELVGIVTTTDLLKYFLSEY